MPKKRYYSRYCCCIVEGQLDVATFSNPDKDPTAIGKCIKRAEALRKQDQEKGKHWLQRGIYPAIITQILEPEEMKYPAPTRVRCPKHKETFTPVIHLYPHKDHPWSKERCKEEKLYYPARQIICPTCGRGYFEFEDGRWYADRFLEILATD